MEPITIITYIVVSHYGCYIITNFYDYLKFQSNFRTLEHEVSSLRYQVESLETQLHYCTKKILDKIKNDKQISE